jgi:hypothetical protein
MKFNFIPHNNVEFVPTEAKTQITKQMPNQLNPMDYSVQFANIQRVVHNIPEPWKTELANAASDLQIQIQNDLQKLRISQGQYEEIQNFNPPC